MAEDRPALVQRGLRLNYVSIAYMGVEATVSTLAGMAAGSVALVVFGLDSVIELGASAAAQWRLRAELAPARRARVERAAHRVIGWSFLGLGTYVIAESGRALWFREHPALSVPGIGILALSIVLMPALARAKQRVAHGLGSAALRSEAQQTSLCAYLSAIALAGVLLNALLGWWWADPVAALAMVPIIAKEGVDGMRGRDCDC